MGFLELFITSVGLAMDAFAASVCKGLSMPRINWRQALIMAFFFGFFQAAMPIIGWLLGSVFAGLIEPVDHWVAFVLLAIVGAKMIWDAVSDSDVQACGPGTGSTDFHELIMLSIATSIDALAVGISLALLSVNIWFAAAVIGTVTFVLCVIGVLIGNIFGSRFERPAGILGGIVLIIIGLKIVLEHMGILHF